MSLTASMWTGVTGLMAHGERMNVIGNNISNVNTVGFKSQRMDFADFIYQDAFSLSGMTQIGRGVRIGALMGDFSGGAFESTNEMTDLAIGGNGFFRVKPVGSEMEYYTRAGNFRFNAEGLLMDPNGNVVQGWKFNPDGTSTADALGSGALTDVRLNMAKLDPLQTSKLTVQANLSRNIGSDKATNPDNPFTAMLNQWDTQAPASTGPLSTDFYSYATSLDVYDEAGVNHEVTIYFDQIDPDAIDGKPGERMWEYVVAINPAEDMRQVAVDGQIMDMSDTKYGGILMAGTLTFDSTGKLSDMSAYTLQGNRPTDGEGFVQDELGNPVPILDAANIAKSLFPAQVSKDGFPVLTANFSGLPGANTTSALPRASRALMEIDFGLKAANPDNPWNNSSSLSGTDAAAGGIAGARAAGRAAVGAIDPITGERLTPDDVELFGEYVFRNRHYVEAEGSTSDGPYIYESRTSYAVAREIALYNAAERPETGITLDAGIDSLDTLAARLEGRMKREDWPLDDDNNDLLWKKFVFTPGSAPTEVEVPEDDGPALKRSVFHNPMLVGATGNGQSTSPIWENPRTGVPFDNVTERIMEAEGNALLNPDYDPDTPGSPPYLYYNEYCLENAWGAALVKSAERLGHTVDPRTRRMTLTPEQYERVINGVTRADWPRNEELDYYQVTYPPATQYEFFLHPAGPTTLFPYDPAEGPDGPVPGIDNLANMTATTRGDAPLTSYKGESSTTLMTQNGYGASSLSSYSVDAEGVLYGIYSNGQTLPLFQLALFDFNNRQGLRREGGNLFSETLDSGAARAGTAGNNGLGSINAQMLETSNVDLSREFVNMITTQRGYQSNSKVITTTDTMLETAINLKR